MPEARCPLAGRFFSLARVDGEAVALLGPDGRPTATRSALAQAALELSGELRPCLPEARPVVLSLPNGERFVRSFLALRRIGAPVALVDASAPADELRRCAAAIGAGAVLATPERISGQTVWDGDGLALGLQRDLPIVALPDGTVVLKLTSGSSGLPKAIALSARQLAADGVQIMRTMGFGSRDVTLAAIPLTHSYGLGSCLLPLLLAGTPQTFPTCALPAALAATLAASDVAHFPAVPAMIRALATLPRLPEFPHLRVVLAAGAPLAPRDATAFHAATGRKVHVFYGSSECGGITYDRSSAPSHAPGAVGTPMARVDVELVDGEGRVLPAGAEGRVRVRSRAVALAAIPTPEELVLAPGVFLTGDLGRFDAEGRLTLTGRVGETLNVAGKKVHPDEVRRVLEAIPGVASAVVTGLPDRHRGDLIAAVVAVEPGATLTVRAILSACRDRLAPHKLPRRVVLVDELPVSDRGKLRRDDLLALLGAAEGTEPPR